MPKQLWRAAVWHCVYSLQPPTSDAEAPPSSRTTSLGAAAGRYQPILSRWAGVDGCGAARRRLLQHALAGTFAWPAAMRATWPGAAKRQRQHAPQLELDMAARSGAAQRLSAADGETQLQLVYSTQQGLADVRQRSLSRCLFQQFLSWLRLCCYFVFSFCGVGQSRRFPACYSAPKHPKQKKVLFL